MWALADTLSSPPRQRYGPTISIWSRRSGGCRATMAAGTPIFALGEDTRATSGAE
jgi:hypothetical protein